MANAVSISAKCPICKKSLMDYEITLNGKPSIKLNIQGGGMRGTVHLCSIYGSYDHQSDIDINRDEIAEFSCPSCNQILTGKEVCDNCGAPLITLLMEVGGKVTICSRKGCSKHYVAFEDIYETMRKFYSEYGF
jgi:ssDNA-binding Zn-finger/Zn-ribbon topoisomerase 1